MSHNKDREFYRENVETLRSAFTEILHYHFLLLSALIPEMMDAIQTGISKALAEKSEEKEKLMAEIESFLDPRSDKATLFRIPRERAISSFSVGKAIEFNFKYLERGEPGALKAVLDHQQEAFELFVTMIPPQAGILRSTLNPFEIRMNGLVRNSNGVDRYQIEYLGAKENLMPSNLRLWIHKANVALDYLQDNPAPMPVIDLPIAIQQHECRRPVWNSTDNSFAELIVELHKKGYIDGQSPMDVLGAVAPLFDNVNPDGRTLWQGIANRSHKGNRFSCIPAAPKARKKTSLKSQNN
jgi:hypothetical protein